MDISGLDRMDADTYDLPMLNLLVLMDSVWGNDPILRRRVLAHRERFRLFEITLYEDGQGRAGNNTPA